MSTSVTVRIRRQDKPHAGSRWATFTVPFEEGPSEVGFMISQSMHPDEIASQEPVFWQVVDSVRFHEMLY